MGYRLVKTDAGPVTGEASHPAESSSSPSLSFPFLLLRAPVSLPAARDAAGSERDMSTRKGEVAGRAPGPPAPARTSVRALLTQVVLLRLCLHPFSQPDTTAVVFIEKIK